MAIELFDALLAMAGVMPHHFEGVADTGSSSSLLKDDQLQAVPTTFTRGILLMRSGALARKAIQVEEHSPGALAFVAQASAVAAGDLYTVASGKLGDLYQWIAAVNRALEDLGPIVNFDETLLSVPFQEEYTLPATVQDVGFVEVGIAGGLPPLWQPFFYFYETGGVLRFRPGAEPRTDGDTLRLWYRGLHPAVKAEADDLAPGIHVDRLKWSAKRHLMLRHVENAGQLPPDDPSVQLLNEAARMETKAARHTFLRMPVSFATWA